MDVKPKISCEWGGTLRAIIDGKSQNVAEWLNKLEAKKPRCCEYCGYPKNGPYPMMVYCSCLKF